MLQAGARCEKFFSLRDVTGDPICRIARGEWQIINFNQRANP